MFKYASAFNRDIGDWTVDSVPRTTWATCSMADLRRHVLTRTSAFGRLLTSWLSYNMSHMFNNAAPSTRTSAQLGYDPASSMASMFYYAQSLTRTSVVGRFSSVTSRLRCSGISPSFNGDIGAWDTSGVTGHGLAFYDASAFNQDIGDWAVGVTRWIWRRLRL